MQLVEEFAAVSAVRSPQALHSVARRFVDDMEFERYGLQLVANGSLSPADQRWASIDNVPAGYLPSFSNRANGLSCPVMQHAKKSSLPLYWDHSTYRRASNMRRYDAQRPWGYGAGFIVAAHLRQDKHVVVGVEREKELQEVGPQLTHKLAMFQLFATCAIDACVTILGEEHQPSEACPLSGRELEVLQWTLDGKTAWEVGAILSISQGTAAQYVNSAARKLGAVNKHQAALKALRLGWIH